MTAAPDLAAPVIAFRTWRLAGERLVSPFIPCRWDGRSMHAECFDANRSLVRGEGWLSEPHRSPHPDCQCGIYAYHSPGPRNWFGEAWYCEGVVSAWGRIEVHSDGLRAEHARVEGLARPEAATGRWADAVEAVAARLGVPIVDVESLAALAARLGGGVPSPLLPAAPG